MTKVISFPKTKKTEQKKYERVNGEPRVGELFEKIKTDMRMGVTFWDYQTKVQLEDPKKVLLQFVMQKDLQIRAPLDEHGDPVVMCDARRKGEHCPLCSHIEGKTNSARIEI